MTPSTRIGAIHSQLRIASWRHGAPLEHMRARSVGSGLSGGRLLRTAGSAGVRWRWRRVGEPFPKLPINLEIVVGSRELLQQISHQARKFLLPLQELLE
jgi:hypothetical protein